MALDQYSLCPCGSGKKIKFCKCGDNLQEMEKVERMIHGDQSVAALDRISTLLKTYPSDAWLYAFKCELLLKLREIEPLEEASAKFIRLRPDNPLARMYRSLVAILRGNTEESAGLLLQAMADSTESLHPFFVTVSANLIESMIQQRMVLPALMHSELLLDVCGESSEIAMNIYQTIIAIPEANILSRESIPSPKECDDMPWSERFRESMALVNRYQVTQAKTKLEGIQREFGAEPSILVALLHCKILLADLSGAATTCQKLAEHNAMSEPERIYFQALAYELDPAVSGIRFEDELVEYVIPAEQEFEEKLANCKLLHVTNGTQLKEMVVAILREEVPPRLAYNILEPILLDQFPESNTRMSVGWAALFGKQTDKPARFVIAEPKSGPQSDLWQRIQSELGLNHSHRRVVEIMPRDYFSKISSTVILEKAIAPERQLEFHASLKQYIKNRFYDCPFGCLGGQSPRVASKDPIYRVAVAALLLHMQGSTTTMLFDDDFLAMHADLGLQRPNVDAADDTFDTVGGASYFWTDLNTIDSATLIQLMQSALTRSVTGAFAPLASRATTMDWPIDLKASAEYTTLNMAVRTCSDPNVAEKLLLDIYESGKQLGVSVGNAVLERVDVLNSLGRKAESNSFLQRALQEVPRDPALVQFMQMAMYRMQQQQATGGKGADLSNALLRHGAATRATEPANESGLWTPGQPTQAAPQSSEAGGSPSKLWIPGQ